MSAQLSAVGVQTPPAEGRAPPKIETGPMEDQSPIDTVKMTETKSPESLMEKKTTLASSSGGTSPPSRTREQGQTRDSTMPEEWRLMALKIREALAPHRKDSINSSRAISRTSSTESTMLLPDPDDAGGLAAPPVDYYIHITDEIREFSENSLDRSDLTANKSMASLNEMMRAVSKYNQLHCDAPATDFTGIVQRSHIVKRDQLMAEVFLENLTPQEQMRLRASERQYQRKMFGSIPLFKKFDEASDANRTPSGLAVELSGSVAMALSLLSGLLLSFVAGYLGGQFFGIKNPAWRAVLGLIMAVSFLAVEVSLLLIRYFKLERIRAEKKRRYETRMDAARQKYRRSGQEPIAFPAAGCPRSEQEAALAGAASECVVRRRGQNEGDGNDPTSMRPQQFL